MPRLPIDYSKSVIYTIIHINDITLNYVGSTTDFTKRKYGHKQECKSSQLKLYVMIRDNGNWDMFKMSPYKEFPCQSSFELRIEEERCRLELNATLNDRRCYRTEEQIKEDDKIYKKKNEEKIKEYYTKYNLEHQKEHTEYKKKNKEKLNQKINCECGGKYTHNHKAHHFKTQQHINFNPV